MVQACRGLTAEQLGTSVPGTYGELGKTLAHLAGAESRYVQRLSGDQGYSYRDGDPVPSVDEILALLESSGSALIELSQTVPADQVVDHTFLSGDRIRVPAWVILNQAIDHAKEHRTHAAVILTQLGIEPPDVDGWAFGEAEEAGLSD
jgi:uncharacterized damage-inducible protein DinB